MVRDRSMDSEFDRFGLGIGRDPDPTVSPFVTGSDQGSGLPSYGVVTEEEGATAHLITY